MRADSPVWQSFDQLHRAEASQSTGLREVCRVAVNRRSLPAAWTSGTTGRCLSMKVVTQVQDSSYGKPAVGVRARLARAVENDWVMVADAETNNRGRITEWNAKHLERGLYQIAFDADAYFAALGVTAAYPEIIVVFRARDELNEFQVHVTLAPFSYTAYCGTADA